MNWNGEQRQRLEQMPSSAYLAGWPRVHDAGVAARTTAGEPVGAAWYRRLRQQEHGYGWVADDVPELTLGVVPGFRGLGTGTRLMHALIERARADGERALSLSVEDGNPVRRLYERLGFRQVGRNGGSDTLLLDLRSG